MHSLFLKNTFRQVLHPTPNSSPSSCRRHASGVVGAGYVRQQRKLSRNGARNAAMSFLRVIGTSAALAADKDPPVPPGRDPGGVAIAIIGPGIDYTWSEISKHLARDGEGEIIGWDFVDNDRRPFEHRKNNADNPYTSAQWVVLKIIDKAPNTRIVPLRVGEPNALQLGRAATYVGQSPAKIALGSGLN